MSFTDFNISISTENGTGSLTANTILTKSLIKSGFYASSKNLFPSNIAGLPTLFKIRVSSKNYTSCSTKKAPDVFVAFNKKTFEKDLASLSSDTFLISKSDFKSDFEKKMEIPCRKLVKELHSSISVKKLLHNMLYVGAVLKLTGADLESSLQVTEKTLKKLKPELIEANTLALKKGFELADSPLVQIEKSDFKETHMTNGNESIAMGFLDGGAQVVTWYPITPSSSVAESFEKFSSLFTTNPEARSVLQCEDEISSAVAALGAGWSGARSFTATSGPGLSLMQEAIGLGYFTESPFVILDVQRMGPSTGLPTRTSQGDLILAHYSSHGDTLHPVLIPGTPQEAYDDGFGSLNLSQKLQTPVIVLSDLDLGMNEWLTEPLKRSQAQIDKGEVQLESSENFKRYSNEQDVPTRSLPRLSDSSLAYFTRGTGHTENGDYSEDPDVYTKKLTRLKDKIINAKNLKDFYPKDLMELNKTASFSIICTGTTGQILPELKEKLSEDFSFLRVRSLPLDKNINEFLSAHKVNFVIEQNRDGQLNQIVKTNFDTPNTFSINQFNGQPIDPDHILTQIFAHLELTS